MIIVKRHVADVSALDPLHPPRNQDLILILMAAFVQMLCHQTANLAVLNSATLENVMLIG